MDGNLIMNQLNMCRTCLQQIMKTSSVIYIDSALDTEVSIGQKLNNCIPELNLKLIPNAVICKDCYDVINSFDEFKTKCLQFEMVIIKYMEQTQHSSSDVNLLAGLDQTQLENSEIKMHKEDCKVIEFKRELEMQTDCTDNDYISTCSDVVSQYLPQINKEETQSEFFFKEPYSDYVNSSEHAIQNYMEFPVEEKLLKCTVYEDPCCERIDMKMLPKEQIFKCSVCVYQSNKKINLRRHMQIHSTDKVYSCVYCNYRNNRKINLERHMIVHTKDKPFMCSICDYRTKWKASLQKHMPIHSDEKPFECLVCDYRTHKKVNLYKHMKVHSTEREFKCVNCDYRTGRKSNLESHMIVHTNEKPFQCSICNYQTKWKATLDKHMPIHSHEKPIGCTVCEYRTNKKINLERHMQVHSTEKVLKCLNCDYSTNRKTNLERHMVVHTNEKPIKCSICDFRTKLKINLQTHMLVHSNEKRFKCSVCNYRSNQRTHLRRHMNIHANDNSSRCSVKSEIFLQSNICLNTNDESLTKQSENFAEVLPFI